MSDIPTTPINTFTLSIDVADSNSTTTSAAFSLTVNSATPQALSFTATSLPSATRGTYYSAGFDVTGGIGPYTYSLTSGNLDGLTLNNGIISGTPTASGSFAFSINASNTTSSGVTQSFTLSVN